MGLGFAVVVSFSGMIFGITLRMTERVVPELPLVDGIHEGRIDDRDGWGWKGIRFENRSIELFEGVNAFLELRAKNRSITARISDPSGAEIHRQRAAVGKPTRIQWVAAQSGVYRLRLESAPTARSIDVDAPYDLDLRVGEDLGGVIRAGTSRFGYFRSAETRAAEFEVDPGDRERIRVHVVAADTYPFRLTVQDASGARRESLHSRYRRWEGDYEAIMEIPARSPELLRVLVEADPLDFPRHAMVRIGEVAAATRSTDRELSAWGDRGWRLIEGEFRPVDYIGEPRRGEANIEVSLAGRGILEVEFWSDAPHPNIAVVAPSRELREFAARDESVEVGTMLQRSRAGIGRPIRNVDNAVVPERNLRTLHRFYFSPASTVVRLSLRSTRDTGAFELQYRVLDPVDFPIPFS